MNNLVPELRDMAATLKGAVMARPNDKDGEAVGNIARLFVMCADEIERLQAEVFGLCDALMQAVDFMEGRQTPVDKLSKAREIVASVRGGEAPCS